MAIDDDTSAEPLHSTVFAEQMMSALRAKLIIAKIIISGEQAKIVGFDDSAPVTHSCTERTVAFTRAIVQIDMCLVANGATVTAAGTCLLHGFSFHVPANKDPSRGEIIFQVIECSVPTASISGNHLFTNQ